MEPIKGPTDKTTPLSLPSHSYTLSLSTSPASTPGLNINTNRSLHSGAVSQSSSFTLNTESSGPRLTPLIGSSPVTNTGTRENNSLPLRNPPSEGALLHYGTDHSIIGPFHHPPQIKVPKPCNRVSMSQAPRRSSTRSIKRKKFDDELVESSLIKTERGGRIKPPPVVEKIEQPPPPEKEPPPPPEPKKKVKTNKSSAAAKRVKRQKPPPPASTKDLGRWKPQDDLALISAVQQTSDLTAVHLGVKFSCKFTLKEIQERWYALLYDPAISKLSLENMKQLHPDVIASVQGKALYSKTEENLLGSVASTSQPSLDVFQKLLDENPDNFHPARTAKVLHCHWLLMKQYHLLPDQSVQPMPRGDHVLNFSDAEDMMDDDDLKDGSDEAVKQELSIADRRNKKEIRHLENEIPKWQVLVDSVTGISPADFDNQTLAVLRGRLVRYLMRSREITLGRATEDNQIDVDLSLEGPAWKISRRQGVIKLRNNGDFFIANEGKRAIFVDGKPILAGNKQKLNNNSVVEISCLRFIFLINQDLINAIRQESQKMVVT